MAIIRAKRDKNFSIFDNKLLRDSEISFKARGLLTYMLSMPDNWKFYVSELATHSKKEGESAIRSAIEELEKAGYMKRVRQRGEKGRFSSVDWYVYDEPKFSPHSDFPHVDKPHVEEPQVDNRPLPRTNSTKNLKKEELIDDDDSLRADLDVQMECHRNIQPIIENYELNFGQVTQTERSQLMDEYRDWYEEGVPKEDILAVFNNVIEKAAIYRAKAPAKYSVGILRGYLRNKIWTVEAIEGEDKQFEAKKQQRQNSRNYNSYNAQNSGANERW